MRRYTEKEIEQMECEEKDKRVIQYFEEKQKVEKRCSNCKHICKTVKCWECIDFSNWELSE